MAAFKTTDPEFDDRVVRTADGVVPAMPKNILQCNSTVCDDIKQIMREDRDYYCQPAVKI